MEAVLVPVPHGVGLLRAQLVLHGARELVLLHAGEKCIEALPAGGHVTMRWQVVGDFSEERGTGMIGQLLHAIVSQRRILVGRQPRWWSTGKMCAALREANTGGWRWCVEERRLRPTVAGELCGRGYRGHRQRPRLGECSIRFSQQGVVWARCLSDLERRGK